MCRLAKTLVATTEQTYILAALGDDKFAPPGYSLRAKIILNSIHGEQIKTTAEKLGVNILTVRKWRQRFKDFGLAGIQDSVRRREPRIKKSPSESR